ncbi:MAG: hypothetical protein ACFE0O_04910 [Opitutales bacterium]
MNKRKRKRRGLAQVGLSFLDCICCGFGAVILLFVLTMGAQTRQVRGVNESLNEILQKRLEQMARVQASTAELEQQVAAQEQRLNREQSEEDQLAARISDLMAQLSQAEAGRKELITEIEEAQQQIASRQRKLEVLQRASPDPVGIPVESNHLIFIIDTSGSMRDQRTGNVSSFVQRTLQETLLAYPVVEAIQVLDSSGNYIVRQSNGRWLEDGQETRNGIARALANYPIFSVSNPVPGIIRAIRTFGESEDPEVKVGIYVFGDEFNGRADEVIDRLEVINPRDEEGNRPVTINGVGFPHLIFDPNNFGETGLKFANLMREVTYRHGGAFVGMQPEQVLESRVLQSFAAAERPAALRAAMGELFDARPMPEAALLPGPQTTSLEATRIAWRRSWGCQPEPAH